MSVTKFWRQVVGLLANRGSAVDPDQTRTPTEPLKFAASPPVKFSTRAEPALTEDKSSKRFKVFISHSHQSDRVVANSLKRGLEQFARPRGKRRAMRVFLDTAILTPAPSLQRDIERALDRSDYLLLIASPAAASSKWVQREIEYWLSCRDENSVIIAHHSGSLTWSDADRSFDPVSTNCLPPALLSCFGDEPLYLDIQSVGEDADEGRFWDTIASLSSLLLQQSKDELIAEDLRTHRIGEAENLMLRSKLELLSGKNSDAIRLLIESYKLNNAFSVLQELVSLHNLYNGDIAWQTRLQEATHLSALSKNYVVVLRDRAESDLGETLVVAREDEVRFRNSRSIDLIDRETGTLFKTLYDFEIENHPKSICAVGSYFYFMNENVNGLSVPDLNPIDAHERQSHGYLLCRHEIGANTPSSAVGKVRYPGAFAVSPDGTKIAAPWFWGASVCRLTPDGHVDARPIYSSDDFLLRTLINEYRFSRSGRLLGFCGGNDSWLDNSSDYVGVIDIELGEKCFDFSKQIVERFHTKQVNSIDISLDESVFATASNDGTTVVVGVNDGEIIVRCEVGAPVNRVRFVSGGQHFVTITDEMTTVWETHTGRRIKTYSVGGKDVLGEPAEDTFYTIGSHVHYMSLSRSERIADFSMIKQTGLPAFDEEGRIAAVPCHTGGWHNSVVVRIFDMASGSQLGQCAPGVDDVQLLRGEVSASGHYLALSTGIATPKEDSENTWRVLGRGFTVFDLRDFSICSRIACGRYDDDIYDEIGTEFAFHPKADLLAMSIDSTLRVFSLRPYKELCRFDGIQSHQPICWNHSGDMLAAIAQNGQVLILHFNHPTQSIIDTRKIETGDLTFETLEMAFDPVFDHFFIFLKNGTQIKIALSAGKCYPPSHMDVRQENLQIFARQRLLRDLPIHDLPVASPYLHRLDGEMIRIMGQELSERSPGITLEAEEFLERIGASTF